MVALALVGLVSMGIFSVSQDTLKTIQHDKLTTTRDQLATQFRQNAGRFKNLHLSLKKPENSAFYNCVCGKGSGCSSLDAPELALYDNSVPDKPIASYYDYAGIPCSDKAAASCVIYVKTVFKAQCKPVLPSADPTPPVSCVGEPVEFFAVSFEVAPNHKSPDTVDLFKSVSGSAFTQVSTLLAGSTVCD